MTLYLAHRGFWRPNGIENTIQAFDTVISHLSNDLQGFECDFQQLDPNDPTSWVIFHDDHLNRLSESDEPLTTSNVRTPIFNSDKSTQSNIPTLTDFLTWLTKQKKPSFTVNIEIKKATPDGLSHLVSAINTSRTKNIQIVYSSFDVKSVHWIQKNTKEQVAYLIKSTQDLTHIKQDNLFAISIGFSNIFNIDMQQLAKFNCKTGLYFESNNDFIAQFPTLKKHQSFELLFTEPNANDSTTF